MATYGDGPETGYEQARFPTQTKHTNGFAASLVVNTGPCLLIGFSVYNSNAADQFIQVFDATVAPATGGQPAAPFKVKAGDNLGVYYGEDGRPFLNGCVIANSSTADTFTAGSADCYIDAQYSPC